MKRELCAVHNGGLEQTAGWRDGSAAFDEVGLMFFTWPSCAAFCLGFGSHFAVYLWLADAPRPGKEGLLARSPR